MTDASVALHTGTHAGLWGAVEVAFAAAVLVVAVGLVAALLLEAREGTPEARLATAFSTVEGSGEDASADGERPSLGHREG